MSLSARRLPRSPAPGAMSMVPAKRLSVYIAIACALQQALNFMHFRPIGLPSHRGILVTRRPVGLCTHSDVVPRRLTHISVAALSDASVVEDMVAYCSSPPSKKVAAVYAVYGADSVVRYVGVARDAHMALAQHMGTQPVGEVARASVEVFSRPDRAAMAAMQAEWITSLGVTPVGNIDADNAWGKPPLSAEEAGKKMKMRQAIADDSLRDEDPEAWRNVVRKAMKDGDFDGSAEDFLDMAIDADAEATSTRSAALRRAAGDWQGEVEAQTAEALGQAVKIEMYFAPGCPHCERMRGALKGLGVVWSEFNVEAPKEEAALNGEQTRRARHALYNTVPQLYLLREPPYNGRDGEKLVGGADDLEKLARTPLW
eukprot:CAMPEP_0177194448 /NCGR_PEP_ID=MMETSP0367-20130122/22980_1 /TAXON_ID=447022 ORGANISM="Scrippsiella hangoei-like, Strain SHHI-4" /NCGR_SAMPLE_ID=MMETSP0367 /ASSEMBLY_ACC=CAM_ASM_000362 /LENGTH=370 /DNA_ID=CAMNT_0018642399 /DNA_START=66 /DNA_END=1175 /DNA_ORIENTATION=-